ncbi:MAG TPA: AraC family transcriptional regulator [Candidatus Baltobacteraceae bacterium]|jgi:transcriptional regulator GlxA family with amidase domain
MPSSRRLLDTALDQNHGRLFSKRVIPSRGALQLVKRAANCADDEAFDSVIFTLFDEAASISTKNSAVEAPKLRMQRAKRFIERHAFEQLQLDDIATELGLSPFTILRQFRAATGRTPYAYLLEIRLERAKQLLGQTTDSIARIASKVGFNDPAHFSRFFSNTTGYSPSSYRAVGGEGPDARTF